MPDGENMISAKSISQSTDNSYAFLISPFRRLEYVTCLLVGFSIFLISSLTLPIATQNPPPSAFLATVTKANTDRQTDTKIDRPKTIPGSRTHYSLNLDSGVDMKKEPQEWNDLMIESGASFVRRRPLARNTFLPTEPEREGKERS